MSQDLALLEERAKVLETQMRGVAQSRERLFAKLSEELAGAHVFVRDPVVGWQHHFDPGGAEQILTDLAGVARLHSGLLLRWIEVTRERDAIVSKLPPAARSTIGALRLLPGGGGS